MLPNINHIKITLVLFLAISLLVGLSSDGLCAEETDSVASVIAVRGDVQAINKKGESRKLKIKTPLFLKDTIKTGKRGRLQIMFKDKTIVSLGSTSEMKISEYVWDKEKGDGKITTEVKEGAFRVMGGLISKAVPKKFKTKTPVATIGIRGSMYAGNVTTDGELSVVFEGGKGITLQNSTGITVITTPGYGSHVKSWDAPISKPAKFTTRDIMNLNKDFMSSRTRKPSARTGRQDAVIPPVTFSGKEMTDLKEGAPEVSPEEAVEEEPEADAEQEEIEESEEAKEEDQAKKEPATEQEKLANELSAAVKENPQDASNILRDAVTSNKMNTRQALEAVLTGMQNIEKANFDKLVNEAIKHGLTAEGARETLESMKAKGVCR